LKERRYADLSRRSSSIQKLIGEIDQLDLTFDPSDFFSLDQPLVRIDSDPSVTVTPAAMLDSEAFATAPVGRKRTTSELLPDIGMGRVGDTPNEPNPNQRRGSERNPNEPNPNPNQEGKRKKSKRNKPKRHKRE
jgi:hypothetical protein